MAKQKFYPLKGEAENADELNKYQAYRKDFQSKLPKSKPRVKPETGPTVIDYQRSKSLFKNTGIKPVIDSTIGKLSSNSSRADSVKAYLNAAKGVAVAEKKRIVANKLLNAAYESKEKGRIARPDASSVNRNLAIPLAPTYNTPQKNELLAKKLSAKK
jgi:hypothetical protein